MIKLKVLSSSIFAPGHILEFQFDILKIGSSKVKDLIIPVKDCNNNTFNIEVTSSGAVFSIEQKDQYYFVNQKKFSGKKYLSANDEISLHNFSFIVLDFFVTLKSKKPLKKHYHDAIRKNPQLTKKLSLISNEILNLEELINHENNE